MKQSRLSEMVDRIVESIAKVQKADELVLQQECIDIKDDARRRKFRENLTKYLSKLEGQLVLKSDNSVKTLAQINKFLAKEYEIEDKFEEADDDIRELNLKKLDEALEELRKACRDFEIRSIEEVKDMRKRGLSRYSIKALEEELQKKKSSCSSGNLNNCKQN